MIQNDYALINRVRADKALRRVGTDIFVWTITLAAIGVGALVAFTLLTSEYPNPSTWYGGEWTVEGGAR